MAYPTIGVKVNGKSYQAIAVGSYVYLIWTVARDTGANITKAVYGDVEIGGKKVTQVTQGGNTFLLWSAIPTLSPNPSKVGGAWSFTTQSTAVTATGVGGGNSPILDLTKPPIRTYIYSKYNIGGWFFDAILQASHTSTLTITSHPVQLGSSITDYAYLQPRTISLNIGMSDVAQSFIPGQFAGGQSRSVQAYQILKQLQQLRIPVQVYTRIDLYQNMLVETLTVQDDNTTTHGLRCTVDMQELLVASVQTVKISSNPGVTSNAKQGQKQPQQPASSILYQLGQLINGK